MPSTKTEQRIKHKKKRKGILVPLIEDYLLHHPIRIEDDLDIAFMVDLMKRGQEREEERKKDGPGVFSPSALASCLRHVYLNRHWQEEGLVRLKEPRAEANYYFSKGDEIHRLWQLAAWKMHRHYPDSVFKLLGYEERIISKRKDHGGTLDLRVAVYEEPIVVDVKGVNVRVFTDTVHKAPPKNYSIQLADYMVLWNSTHGKDDQISRGVLLSENKGGPDKRHPVALHETIIELRDFQPEIRKRLEVLRQHEADKEIPEPECTSINTFQFQGCPFRAFCRKEVQAKQKQINGKDSEGFSLAVSRRRRNSRTK